MVGRAFEFVKYTLDGSKICQGLLLNGRRILVFEIAKLYEKINLLGVHRFDTSGKLIERMPVIACADSIGVCIVAIGNDAESHFARLVTAADRSLAGKRRQRRFRAGQRHAYHGLGIYK